MNPGALAVHGLWWCCAAPAARRFARATQQPERTQRDLLAGLLRRNAGTEFGRAHGFASLRSVEEFQAAVPARDYAGFQPWMDAAIAGRPDVLTPGKPLAFLPTSGTQSGAKLIPWTAALKGEFQAALGPWVHGFMRQQPAAWRGSVYWSLSPPLWPQQRTGGGIPVGFDSDAAYLPAFLQLLLGAAFAVPAAVAALREPEAWRYATLLHLLGSADLSLVSVWSPTFLSSLLEPLPAWWPALLRDLENGTFTPPAGDGSALCGMPGPRGGARRAQALRGLACAGGRPALERIWPRLAAISCWTDAAARGPARELARLFPQARVVGKGLVATEGVVSFPWPDAEAPALALTSHFFEFVDAAGRAHPAWDLRHGQCYAVLLTTGGGLYRYRLHDRIRVAGFHHACPLLEFLGRDGVTCDLCGEKLTEPLVRECLGRVARELGQEWPFALLAPAASGRRPGYTLFIASVTPVDTALIARAVDAGLGENVHYAHARRIEQLAPLEVVVLRGDAAWAWARFHATQAARGRRLGDIKPTTLDCGAGWQLVFEPGAENPNLAGK